jgi:glyoxylate/hydroxypyruvate reductase
MANILLAIIGWDPKGWEQRFRSLALQHSIRVWPERVGNPDEITYACVWRPPEGLLAGFSNLKAIFSLGAGADELVADASLPRIPIGRIVDPDLTMRMGEYVALHVLMHHRRQRLYDAQQHERLWREHDQPVASDVAVGVMGLGVLGSNAAFVLHRLGFRVAGWSRTPKSMAGIETFHGRDGLDPFLRRTEILICLLPSTPETEGLLNLSLFTKLKRKGALGGAYLINVGRGTLQIDVDILSALDSDLLAGATLDVFPTEPLPVASMLWSHPKVTITPHNAAACMPRSIVANVLRQIDRCELGLPLEYVIDRITGY